MDGYYDLATNLGTVDPPLFIFGGIAEDILFHGRLTRPHSDIDVLIYRDEVYNKETPKKGRSIVFFTVR